MRRLHVAVPLLIVALALGGCGNSTDESAAPETVSATTVEETETTEESSTAPSTATTPAQDTTAAPAQPVAKLDGKALYGKIGCATCHGALARGTKIAPALPGHSPKVIRRQVRAATGDMPSYTRQQVSDPELNAVIAWIGTLPVPKTHAEPVSLPQLVESHFRMAYVALQFDDPRDARHHLAHVIASAKGSQLKEAKHVRALIDAGNMHDAEHAIQDLLGAEHGAKLGSVEKLHLQIALGAAEAGDFALARHQMNHFVQTAKGERRAEGKAILAALARKDEHDAVDGLRDLLGLEHR